MATVQEIYNPVVVGVNTTVKLTQHQLGGFLALTGGTLTVVNQAGVTILNAVPVTAGVYLPIPFSLGPSGDAASVTSAGGASGTLGAI